MPIDTREKRMARAKAIRDARTILEKADEEKRSLTAEEDERCKKFEDEAADYKTAIDQDERRNRLEEEEAKLKFSQEEELRKMPDKEELRKKADEETAGGGNPLATEEYRTAFSRYLTAPGGSHLNSGIYTDEEHRALSAGTAEEGGYLYASEQFVNQLIANVTDATVFRGLVGPGGTFQIPTADSLGAPTLTDMSDAEWTSELGAPSEDSTMAFGKRSLTPHPLAKEVKVSKTLLRKVPAAEGIVRGQLATVVGNAEENAFMTGDGVQKPLGIFVATSDGISTDRDVSTGNTATLVKFDNLKRVKYTLKQVYWKTAAWIFHRDVMGQLAREKDGAGRYLLQDSLVPGEPDRMLNFPVQLSEFAPNTMTTGLYVGMLGDYTNYWIVDAMDVEISRAEELYIRQNQDLFIVRKSTDGAPVREEGFVRVKLG